MDGLNRIFSNFSIFFLFSGRFLHDLVMSIAGASCALERQERHVDGSTNQSAKFSGWGWFNGSQIASEALRATNFTIFTGEYCEQQFVHNKIRNHLENTTIMFCAGTDVSSNYWM